MTIILNVKVYPSYTVTCKGCGELTQVQALDGWGSCSNCDYAWNFPPKTLVGTCITCNEPVSLETWSIHEKGKCLEDFA